MAKGISLTCKFDSVRITNYGHTVFVLHPLPARLPMPFLLLTQRFTNMQNLTSEPHQTVLPQLQLHPKVVLRAVRNPPSWAKASDVSSFLQAPSTSTTPRAEVQVAWHHAPDTTRGTPRSRLQHASSRWAQNIEHRKGRPTTNVEGNACDAICSALHMPPRTAISREHEQCGLSTLRVRRDN